MPECGSQCWLCDFPIRIDTYKGCSHDCKYCFAKAKRDIANIELGESPESIYDFIKGKRTGTTEWCDWNIPLHFGGMSDPLQPIEKKYRRTYEVLKILAETKYPVIISTKGILAIDDEYLELLRNCNVVMQISAVCSQYDRIELGAPKFEDRLKMISVLAENVQRVNVRIQPYMREVRADVLKNISRFAEAGAYGVILEGMKFKKKKAGLVKVAGDFCYPTEDLRSDFKVIKAEAHNCGLVFYSGENRLRTMGDSLSCCGADGIEGFKPNVFNLNHIANGDLTTATPKMKEDGTGAHAFHACYQAAGEFANHKNDSFEKSMLMYLKDHKKIVQETFGLD